MTLDVLSGELIAADSDNRTLAYRLLTYGEWGATNVGRVQVRAGALDLPDPAQLVGNLEHDRTRPLARASALVDSPTELRATFTVARTRAGDDLLAEAAEGLRTGVSVELDGIRVRGGVVEAGRLTAAGFVVAPAFPSAGLVATEHPDEGPDPAPEPPVTPEPDPPAPTDPPAPPDPQEDPVTVQTPAPPAGGLTASALTSGPPAGPGAQLTAPDAFRLMASAMAHGAPQLPAELRAALQDITYSANALTHPPQWIDEVWSAMPYTRQIVPLLNHGELTALQIEGWRWVNRPVMAAYTGDKAAVPSNAVSTEAVSQAATRYAGAHDVDRAFVDFGNDAFWSGYWSAMAASYAKLTDNAAAAAVLAGATPVPIAGQVDLATALMSTILAVSEAGPVTFVLISNDLLVEVGTTPSDQLASVFKFLGLSIGPDAKASGPRFGSWSGLPAATVLAGTRNAATFYELGGGSPIRVGPVENIGNGGVDVGAFGYAGTVINDASGLAVATVGGVAGTASRSSKS